MPHQRFFSQLLTRWAALLIFAVSLAAPILFFYAARNFIAGNLESETEETARQITHIVTRNPELWEFEQDRLEAVLESRPDKNPIESRRVYNSANKVVAESLRAMKNPIVTASHEIMDSGIEVGRLEISRTLRPLVLQTLLLQAFFLGTGLIFFLLLRSGIDRSLGEAERQMQLYQQKLREYAEALTSAEEKERRQLAMLLHDDVAQILSLCHAKLEDAGSAKAPGTVRDLEGARELLARTIARTRSMMESLSSQTLEEIGLPAALESLCRAAEAEHGLHVSLKVKGDFSSLPRSLKTTYYRSARELLLNVAKHARAESVAVSLQEDGGRLRLAVTDDGCGLTVGQDHKYDAGFGLFSIRENMRSLGGTVEIRSPGVGTRIVLEAPADNGFHAGGTQRPQGGGTEHES